jgi:hypothetical protein
VYPSWPLLSEAEMTVSVVDLFDSLAKITANAMIAPTYANPAKAYMAVADVQQQNAIVRTHKWVFM